MSKARPTYQELERRLEAAEAVVKALKNQEVDAVVGENTIAFLLLREVEEALRISDAAFRAMFELCGVGMFQADAPGFRITRVNQKFCEITGYTAEEMLTKTYISLTYPGDRRQDMSTLASVLRGKADSWSLKKRFVRKDGSVVWASVHGAVLRDAAGRAATIVGMIGDLTVRRPVEEELHAADPPAAKGKPLRPKKAADKKARGSAAMMLSDKSRLRRR